MNMIVRNSRKLIPAFRKFSSDTAGHEKEIITWRQISFAMMSGCLLATTYNVYEIINEGHPHGTPQEVPYMHNRAKPFPWKCTDCDLFDVACWKGQAH